MSESGITRPLGGSGIDVPAVGVGTNRWNVSGPGQARLRDTLAAAQYSLLHRKPETNGVLDACRRMDVALVAYRPIGGGALGSGSSTGPGRSALAGTLREVAAARGATVAQVALAWLLQRDDHVIPIPGATRPEHIRENSAALTLELSEEESAAIDRVSAPAPARVR